MDGLISDGSIQGSTELKEGVMAKRLGSDHGLRELRIGICLWDDQQCRCLVISSVE